MAVGNGIIGYNHTSLYDGNIVRSTDNGTTWDNVTSPTGNHLLGVTFGNNTFVAVGDYGKMVRSTDNGTTWHNATHDDIQNSANWGVVFGNNTFVGVGSVGNIVRSTDNGLSYISSRTYNNNLTSPTSKHLWAVSFGNNTFVAVGISGTIVRSTDNGTTWDNVTSPTANTLYGVGF